MEERIAKTALIYIRRSFIRRGEEALSPEKQEANCRHICEEAGWTAEIYRDAEEGRHFSALTEAGRPAWLQLKRQLGRPDVAAVVVDSLDRAYRSLRDFLNFLNLVEQYGLRFVSRREAIDTESIMGQAFLKMRMIFFELEAQMARERVSEIIDHRKARGIHWGGNPFGLSRNEDGVLIANEDLPTVTMLLELYASGQDSYESLAEVLNAREFRFRDRYGQLQPFRRWSVRSVVCNVLIYLGYVPQGRSADQRPVWDSEGDLVDQLIAQTGAIRGQHETFISHELANRVLAARRDKVKARRPGRVYILSRILYCAHCGRELHGRPVDRHPDRANYRHRGPACVPGKVVLDVDTLEARAIDLLQALKLSVEDQNAIRARAREQGALLPQDNETQKAIVHLQGKLKRLRELYIEGEYGKEEYEVRKRQLLTELQEWQARAGKPDNVERMLLDLGNIAEVIQLGQPVTQKKIAQRKALQALFERLEVDWQGNFTKVVPRRWCLPLFTTLHSFLSQGILSPKAANLETLLDLV